MVKGSVAICRAKPFTPFFQSLLGLLPRVAVFAIASFIPGEGPASGYGQFAPQAVPILYCSLFSKRLSSQSLRRRPCWLMWGVHPSSCRYKNQPSIISVFKLKGAQENFHPGSKKASHYICMYLCENSYSWCGPVLAARENLLDCGVTCGRFECKWAFAASCLPQFPAKALQFCPNPQLREASSSADCSSDEPVLLLLSGGFKTNGASAPGIYHLEDTLLLSCDISLHFYAHLYNCFL